MKRELAPWSKEVKKALIDRDMTVTDLANRLGFSRAYISCVISGKTAGVPEIAARINKELEISTPYIAS